MGHKPFSNPAIWNFTGYCPEQEAFWYNLTGYEFVMLLARLQGWPKKKAQSAARAAIETIGMTEQADRKIGGYSKGMKQRIKIAQCIVHEPEILILDEPLGGTDPLARHHIIRLLHQWERDGKTIIISSHVLEEVERITNNIVLIHRGRLLADGKMSESLSDGERHSVGMSKDDLYVTISTFPCSVQEVQRTHYPRGYLTYLDRMVGIARQENPDLM